MKRSMMVMLTTAMLLGALPKTVLAQTSSPHSDAETSAPARIAGEALGGVLAGIGGMVAISAAAYGVDQLTPPPQGADDDVGEWGMAVTVGALGGALAMPAGVVLAGDWMGGHGAWWATYLGGLSGGGVAVLAFLTANRLEADTGLVGATVVAVPVLTIAGAIVGYELTNDAPVEASAAVYPVLAIGPGRGVMGIGGRF